MRVLLLSTSYPHDAADWRGLFIRQMVDALAQSGDVQLCVWAPPGELPASVTDSTTPAESAWLANLMSAGGISHLIRQGGLNALLAPFKLLRMLAAVYRRQAEVDIYHVNWLQCALPLPDNGKPALITALGNDLKLLRLPFVRHLLRRAIRRHRVAICPNAEWMQAPLEAAFGDIAEVIPVSFGIEERWYAIQRRPAGSQPRRWLAVTRLTADKLGPLFEWSRECFANGSRELHLFGPMQEDIAIPDWVHYHGAASPHQLASQWFPQACGLVTLSRHAEGRPQVMLEAMAAGLPIVASDMPAHAALVEPGRTGLLCSSAEAYRLALQQLEDDTTNQRFGEAARQRAAYRFGTWDDCARRYTTIYRRLLGGTVDG
ncbi:glycosyltransferase [Rhodanobacter denitrificans]|uniref:glycosyltransferase n=1 Tax=Rhodanobacter denitrificans TaxID=666685 RepID=UPI000260E672|nr:glycosyltransferase [Rhodanobacter denitrificans]EIL99422.1 group 1 glycosyl transferase [Rhodanobacter denitrificans]UJM89706.1 glycosyltransferase [Rhodanobacter denitrificans]